MTVAYPTPACPEPAGIADIPSRNDHDRNTQPRDKRYASYMAPMISDEQHSESSPSSSLSSSPSNCSALRHRRVQALHLTFPTHDLPPTNESDSSGSGSSVRSIYKRAHNSPLSSTHAHDISFPVRRTPKLSLDTKNTKAPLLPALACATPEHSPLGAFSPTSSAKVQLRSVVDNGINRIALGTSMKVVECVSSRNIRSSTISLSQSSASVSTFRRLRTSSMRSFTLPWSSSSNSKELSPQPSPGRNLSNLWGTAEPAITASPSTTPPHSPVNVPSISRNPSSSVASQTPPGLDFADTRFDGDSSYRYSNAHNVTSTTSGLPSTSKASPPSTKTMGSSTNPARAAQARFNSASSASSFAPLSLLPPSEPSHTTLKLPGPSYRSNFDDVKGGRGRSRSHSRSPVLSPSPSRGRSPGPSTRPSPFPSQTQMRHSTPALPTLQHGGLNPALAAAERASRLRVECVCGVCGCEGADFPRCPRCSIAWCSRECRVGRVGGTDGTRPKRHVCQGGAATSMRPVPGLGREHVRAMTLTA